MFLAAALGPPPHILTGSADSVERALKLQTGHNKTPTLHQ